MRGKCGGNHACQSHGGRTVAKSHDGRRNGQSVNIGGMPQIGHEESKEGGEMEEERDEEKRRLVWDEEGNDGVDAAHQLHSVES